MKKQLLYLNLILLAYLICTDLGMPFFVSEDIILLTTDAKTYFNAGAEYLYGADTNYSAIRPFFYSSLLRLSLDLGGAWMLFIIQQLMWLLGGNLLFLVLQKITRNKWWSFIGLLIYALNFSLIGYTYHGLTEVISTFLLLIIAYIAVNSETSFKLKSYLYIVFLLSLLTVIKPVFIYPVIIFGCIGGIFILRKLLNIKVFLTLLLALSPLAVQMTYMNKFYGKNELSEISERTLNNYIYAQAVRESRGISDITESQQIVWAMSEEERSEFLSDNFSTLLHLFWKNIQGNIDAYESNFFLNPSITSNEHYTFMDKFNRIYYLLGFLIFACCSLYVLMVIFRKARFNWSFFLVAGLYYYIIFASGISFMQADRLVVFVFPLWLILSFDVSEKLLHLFRKKELQEDEIRSN